MRRDLLWLAVAAVLLFAPLQLLRGAEQKIEPAFHTSDRCMACHNQIATPSGQDVSIGTNWRATIMANSSRDPYWQASVRRETIDQSTVQRDVEDECSICHMPITRFEAKHNGGLGEVFAYLPFNEHKKGSLAAEDGVTCSVCHQISKEKLGTRASFTGQFVVEAPELANKRPEYGPFQIQPSHQLIMDSSTGGFNPVQADHIRDSALCGTCHQLYTTARAKGGKELGQLPEQMPYLEWLHSDYPSRYSCQQCHMPQAPDGTPISSVLGAPRNGMHRHIFVGGNFFVLQMLNRYRGELDTAALPQELTQQAQWTEQFLQTQTAKIAIRNVEAGGGKLQADVLVQNLTGHKLPTAFPSRRAWVHFVVRDRNGRTVFESGALNPDGSVVGNDNDADKTKYEPHYREITSAEQVQVYEDILGDPDGKVTTGLIAAVRYLKDNRLLPTGFNKRDAIHDIAVVGDALDDPNFQGGSDLVHYSVPLSNNDGPFHVEAELFYQPIGFRWAHNLAFYDAPETQRFVGWYDSMATTTATVLARAEASR